MHQICKLLAVNKKAFQSDMHPIRHPSSPKILLHPINKEVKGPAWKYFPPFLNEAVKTFAVRYGYAIRRLQTIIESWTVKQYKAKVLTLSGDFSNHNNTERVIPNGCPSLQPRNSINKRSSTKRSSPLPGRQTFLLTKIET